MAGGAGLVAVAPALAAGAFLSPRVVAVTHLFTLGWITTSILGALYQFLPVALGASIRSEGAAHVTWALHVVGLGALVTSLWTGGSAGTVLGAGLVAAALLLFAVNLAATLRRAEARNLTWWALAAADVFLVVTLLLGWAMAGHLRWEWLGGNRILALGVHLHVALLGWVGLVVVGVAHRLLPMFLLSHGAGERAGKVAVALLASGVGLLVLLHHGRPVLLVALPGTLMMAGVAAFLVQAAAFYRHRRKPVLDPGMRLAAGGLGMLALAAVLAVPAMASSPPRYGLATAYVSLLVLGFSVFVAAHYYKIVPFLVWFHRFGPRAGKGPVPRVSDLYGARLASVAAALLTVGGLGLVAAAGAGQVAATRAAGALFLTGAVLEAGQMAAVARRRPA